MQYYEINRAVAVKPVPTTSFVVLARYYLHFHCMVTIVSFWSDTIVYYRKGSISKKNHLVFGFDWSVFGCVMGEGGRRV